MNARPILFSGPMVRAILDGRKTVTRRLVTSMRGIGRVLEVGEGSRGYAVACRDTKHRVHDIRYDHACDRSPYGKPGDRLWVRETFAIATGNGHRTVYRADSEFPLQGWDDVPPERRPKVTWIPSIFMRPSQSRILLEVVDVRPERLHKVYDEDAKREGLAWLTKDGGVTYKYGIPDRDGWPGTDDYGMPWKDWSTSPREAFTKLWESINGKRAPWDSNPWVWRVEFRRVA